MTKELNENKELKNSTLGKVAFGVSVLGVVFIFSGPFFCDIFTCHSFDGIYPMLIGFSMVLFLSPFLGMIALAKQKDGEKNTLTMVAMILSAGAWVLPLLVSLFE